jgi:hypothetical protein
MKGTHILFFLSFSGLYFLEARGIYNFVKFQSSLYGIPSIVKNVSKLVENNKYRMWRYSEMF